MTPALAAMMTDTGGTKDFEDRELLQKRLRVSAGLGIDECDERGLTDRLPLI
jgi:hypothetical protein